MGIESEPTSPGMAHFILHPQSDPNGQMTYARGHYESMMGKVASSWSVSGGKTTYFLSVPANTSATLFLPAGQNAEVKESVRSIKAKGKGYRLVERTDGLLKMELQSGDYCFEVSVR